MLDRQAYSYCTPHNTYSTGGGQWASSGRVLNATRVSCVHVPMYTYNICNLFAAPARRESNPTNDTLYLVGPKGMTMTQGDIAPGVPK